MGACFSHVLLFVIPWTVAHQPPLSMGFCRQEYWTGLPFSYPEDTGHFRRKTIEKLASRGQSVWRMRGTSLWVFILIRQTEICSATPILLSLLSYFPRYFRQELERLDEGLRKEDMAVHVRRDHVFEDSYRELHRKSPEEMKNRL